MQQIFRVERGLEIDELTQILTGSTLPFGAPKYNLAPVGTIYTQTDGTFWQKITAGAGLATWSKMASEKYVNDAVGATVSWREPAVVQDTVSTTLPTSSASSNIVVDGVTVTDGQRVLFAGLTGGAGKNVYIYDFETGTFAEDNNAESSGDAVYVQSGSSAGKTFIFNGTSWVLSDQSSMDELGFIRSFIGKGAVGSESTNFATSNFVSNGDSLEAAIGKLDTEVGANVSAGNYVSPGVKINANIQALDTAIGANVTNGNFISAASKVQANIQSLDTQIGNVLPAGNYVTSASTTNAAIVALDTALGANVPNGSVVLAANKINANILALDAAVGPKTDLAGGVIVSDLDPLTTNVRFLDDEIQSFAKSTTVNNVTSVQSIDTVPQNTVKWIVRVIEAANVDNVYSTELYATKNSAGADYTKFGTLKLGAAITGVLVYAELDGGNIALKVGSTAAVNVFARRVSVV